MFFKKLNRNFIYLLIIIQSLFFLQACEKPGLSPATKANSKPEPGKPGGPKKPGTEELTCEQKWDEIINLFPKGLETTYQDSQIMKIKEDINILSQSITEKIIKENNGSHLDWQKETQFLAPEQGKSTSSHTLEKGTFLKLCANKFNLTYSDRPSGLAPESKEKSQFKLGEKTFDVELEKYNFSKNNDPINKDILVLAFGIKDSYKGILFASKRTYYKSVNDKIAEINLTKDLINLKTVDK